MLLAFAWWSILLFTKNTDAFQAKTELMQIVMAADGTVKNEVDFHESAEYKALEKKYKRQEWMIFGEASFFVISLVIGVWMINRGYNNKIEASDQQRNFLLSITHELKSPVAAIKLVLETFLKRNLNREQLTKFSENALGDAERLNTLVNNLLFAAKVETAFQPTIEPIAVKPFLEKIINSIQASAPQRSISTEFDKAAITINADKEGMTSVFTNLIENALKYTEAGSDVQVKVAAHSNTCTVQIIDEGPGIPNEERQLIFQKFYRIGNEETRHTKGTGLGLFIVKQVLNAHHGNISVKENHPNGTIMKLRLPCNH